MFTPTHRAIQARILSSEWAIWIDLTTCGDAQPVQGKSPYAFTESALFRRASGFRADLINSSKALPNFIARNTQKHNTGNCPRSPQPPGSEIDVLAAGGNPTLMPAVLNPNRR
jgi:hypothetical protein